MGVIHKLKPEVLNFILENKKNNPALSCRHLTSLVLEQLHIKVSKSSINAIFKDNNLSMPIGRRSKPKKKKFNMPILPVIEESKSSRLDNLAQVIIEESDKLYIEKAAEEARLRDLERLAQEAAENKRQQEEQARKLAEEKAAQEAAKIKAIEEAKLRDLEKAAEELAKIKAAEEARLRDLERLAQEAAENKRQQEEQARKLAEEKAAQELELAAERERWAKLAKEEEKSRQPEAPSKPEEAVPVIVEPAVTEVLPEDRVCSGAIILKALDNLVGGSKEINAAICRGINGEPADYLNLTQTLMFKSLFGKDSFSTLGDLIGVQYPQEKINNYYAQIKQLPDIGLEVAKIIEDIFTAAKGVKIKFTDGTFINLDGQLHSSWPATRFPRDFSNTLYELKNNLNKYFSQGKPLVLFSPHGYDVFPKDFFSLLANINAKENFPENLTIFGNELEELDNLVLNRQQRCCLIFGLWPWQFTSSRKVKKIGDFSLKYIKALDRDLYLGEVEVELLRVSLNQSLTLKGCAIKTDLKEKIRLVILNSNEQALSLEELAEAYLSRWPNFEEGFQDFSRKIEFFTYAGAEQKFFSTAGFGLDTAGLTKELSDIFALYIKILDTYLRWHFLPTEYLEKDLSSTNDYFYKIPVKLITSQNKVKARTLVSQDYQFLKDLEYLNCRLNERQINTASGKVFWFESAFK